ncbi:hypothetical protein Q8W40_15775 [Vibrio penaeicida]|uniref:hypothetical protein n=1 Tax=Vibrio penaeicida TaxID=104609 RepID=UPI0027327E4B|nr:hypothetical protein [Vibrio penaeicida]MDP2573653.1 hypothetical protein [Vibrio penaeicida]
MNFSILLSLFAILVSPFSFSQQNKQYVSMDAWEMGIERVDNKLFRWVLFHPDSEFPCLRTEIMDPVTRTLIKRMNICSIIDNETDENYDFKSLTYIDLYDMRLAENKFMFEAELTLLDSTKVVLMSCGLKISPSQISAPICEVSR